MPAHTNRFTNALFAEHLQAKGILDPGGAQRALSASVESGASLERVVLELGLAEEDAIYKELADCLGVGYATPASLELSSDTPHGLTAEYMARSEVVPISDTDDVLTVATSDPHIQAIEDSLRFHLGRNVACMIASPTTVKALVARLAGDHQDKEAQSGASVHDVDRLRALANDGPVIKLVNEIIGNAVMARASDVHIEAMISKSRVRYRIDGLLHLEREIDRTLAISVVSRLKVMGNLNISEKRRPQDGRAEVISRGRTVDIRMSTLPTQYGESIVLRILDRAAVKLDWDSLGFPKERADEIRRITAMPNGLFLVAGPTGSGKTTTLYTALSEINTMERKIITVEDPIEYALDGVNQVQVDSSVDLGFASALRAILRQDPDVVLVGEIRDEETAAMAVRAALIGRLVFSTIHTNDALGAIDRLRDLGVPNYLIAATLRGVLSQRLVRGDKAGKRNVTLELLKMTPHLQEGVSCNNQSLELTKRALEDGFVPMGSWSKST